MKTAISLPDDLFAAAESLAAAQGVSRSRLFATALAEYVAKHRSRKVSERLNAVYAAEASALDPALRRAQARAVAKGKW
jgi:metal-responsive CopG/Arc/MetJ family transcriptional regulator